MQAAGALLYHIYIREMRQRVRAGVQVRYIPDVAVTQVGAAPFAGDIQRGGDDAGDGKGFGYEMGMRFIVKLQIYRVAEV
jgi:hypothetical protein